MPIDRLVDRSRKQAVWLRTEPSADAASAFTRRGFTVSTLSDEELEQPADLQGIGVVVLPQSRDKALQITRDLERHAERLLDYDCRVIVQPAPVEVVEPAGGLEPPPDLRSIITNYLEQQRLPMAGLLLTDKTGKKHRRRKVRKDDPPPHIRLMSDSDSWDDIANYVVEHPSGNAPALPQHLEVRVADEFGQAAVLEPNKDILVRRAFSNCAEIHLVRMAEGRSGVGVYRAFPKVARSLLKSRWLLPYFIKIGKRKKIFAEYENYVDAVEGYVPFHLGPHLVQDRCCLGAKDEIIVGDWVEESESLRDCARNGRAATAIACLFDRTLHGWYRNAETIDKSVAAVLAPRLPWRRIRGERYRRAKELGATKTLGELRQLLRCCNSLGVVVSPIHGDLHASNVRVRATDAIVIDFFAHDGAPILYDFASLEASLLVEGFSDDLDADTARWMRSIQPLYTTPLNMAPPLADPHDSHSWFYACVRQIRHHAQRGEISDGQYAACLAVALLVKVHKDMALSNAEGSRRAAAYVFAERILTGTFGKSTSAQSQPEAAA